MLFLFVLFRLVLFPLAFGTQRPQVQILSTRPEIKEENLRVLFLFLQAALTACGSRPERSDEDLDLGRFTSMRSYAC